MDFHYPGVINFIDYTNSGNRSLHKKSRTKNPGENVNGGKEYTTYQIIREKVGVLLLDVNE